MNKDEIKSRLLRGEIFAVPRGVGKTHACVELLTEYPEQFLVLTFIPVAREHARSILDGLGRGDLAHQIVSEPLLGDKHSLLVDEIFHIQPARLASVAPQIYAGVGTPNGLEHWQLRVPIRIEPLVAPFSVLTPEEDFGRWFEPRP